MAEAYQISIDLPRLRETFSHAEGRTWTDAEVVEFLEECGFRREGEHWIAEEISLLALASNEYRILRRL